MLRITRVDESDSQVTLRVEGRIVSPWVAELERETLGLLQNQRRVVLDFSEVNFVDSQGAEMLKRITVENVEIIKCSGLIKGLFGE